MVFAKTSIVALICLCIYYVHPESCGGPLRTLTRAVEINSHILKDYLRLLHCESEQVSVSWRVYATKCLQNTTCVGIHSDAPPSMCFLTNASRNEPMQISDLWLIRKELDQFEGLSLMILYFVLIQTKFILQYHYMFLKSVYFKCNNNNIDMLFYFTVFLYFVKGHIVIVHFFLNITNICSHSLV